MNRLKLRNAAILVGIVLIFTVVLSAAAGFDAFTLLSGPTYIDPNYVWTGEATLSNPQTEVCIGFPDADPALAPVHCPWTGGNTFSCVVPLSHFSNHFGDTIAWQIFASPNANCLGNTVDAEGPGSGGNITPTAVSLTSFAAAVLPSLTWLFALVVLALLTGVVVIGRRRLAPGRTY